MQARARTFTIAVSLCVMALTVAGTVTFATSASALGTITQTSGTTFSTDVAGSGTYTDQIQTSGATAPPVTFTTTSSTPNTPPDLVVSGSGAVSTSGPLPAGSYVVSGTDADTLSVDTGTWTYTLNVTGTIDQVAPFSGATTLAGSSTFTNTLNTSDSSGVTFQTTVTNPALTVSPSGVVSTTGSLSANSYTVSGTDSDGSGDAGAWSYTLTVSTPPGGGGGGGGGSPPTTLTQTSPTSAVTTPSASGSFSTSLTTSGSSGAVTYTATTISGELTLAGGKITTTGPLPPGKYSAAGTDSDTVGGTGTWTFTLTVSGGILTQSSPTSATTTTHASKTFAAGRITVTNTTGAVIYVTTTASPALKVTSDGAIATTKALGAGKYKVAGTDSDATGDAGTWSYTLTVTGPVTRVTFVANGGAGKMAIESANSPRALTLNHFTRKKYSFAGWSTTANGRGDRFTNGATYGFTSSVTLYAQWKKGAAPVKTVTFAPNGGAGGMKPEASNTPRALTPNSFTRAGYRFARWSTRPNGAGALYTNGAIYPFGSSTTLYAQWKVHPPTGHTVSFVANGGSGTMATEKSPVEKALTINGFTRPGYKFVGWSASPGGDRPVYPNGAKYSFATSVTFYAQWKKIVIAPTDANATIESFAPKSSALTSSLETQINALAITAKTDHDTAIALAGYGDKLSKEDQLNESIWAANYALSQRRASAVATYLRQRLAAAGVTGFTVTAKGNGSSISTSGASVSTKFRMVVASLT